MRFGSREQSVYPRPKNMPYIPTWREEEHSEVMTPESTTIPTCECACVYVCVQCGGRSTRRWWPQSQPQYLHVSVRACMYVCSVEGGALGGDDPRVNHNTYMWVCVRVCMCAVWREVEHSEVMTPESTTIPTCECACVCMCAVWREVEHSEVMTPESTTIPTCECACVYVCVQCGGRWSTRRWWSQSQPQYLHVSVRACVCMCAVWREVEHSEVMTPESTTIPTCECACVYVCVQCGGRRSTRRWWPQSHVQQWCTFILTEGNRC